MKKYFFTILIIFLFTLFLFHHLSDGERLVSLIMLAKWWYLIPALILQVIYFGVYAILYKESFGIYGINWKFKKVLILLLASFSAGIATPIGAWAGTAVFVHRARKEKSSGFFAGAGVFTAVLFDFLILFLILTISILILISLHKIYGYQITGYIAFIFLFFSITIPIILSFYKPSALDRLLKIFLFIANKTGKLIKHKTLFPEDWVENKKSQFREISGRMMENKDKFKIMFFHSIILHFVNMLCIFLLFLAFGFFINPVYLFISYSLGRMFLVVSPTPQGIGIVDSIMPIIFKSLGIDIHLAILVTLTYRGISLWIPVFLGFFALHKVVVWE